MSVRKAEAKDAPDVARLVNALMTELGGDPLSGELATEAFRDLIAAEPSHGFVMLAGPAGAPHAVCTVSFVQAIRTLGRYGIIQEMYVDPPLRSTGVGKELLEAACAEAVAQGCALIELGTPFEGERQIAFYARSGFANIGARLRWRPQVP